MRISKSWYVKFPRDIYALGPYRFEKPVGEKYVRAYVRKHMGYPRLPIGCRVWPTND